MTQIRTYLLMCAAALTAGCTSAYTERVADVDPRGWHTNAPVTVMIPNADTVASYDLFVLVRIDNTFGARTLPISIRTTTPDGIKFQETLKLNLPVRSPATMKEDFYETLIPYRSDVVLGRTGEYKFEIWTPNDGIRGIWGIGIALKTK